MAEQLALDQLARDGCHVDGDEGTVAPFGVVVQHASDQFLAGARLPGDHDREVGSREPRQDAIDFLHGRRAADQRQLLGIGLRRAALLAPTGLGQRAADDADDLAQVEGLGEILERALLGGRERRHQRVLRTHDDDRQVGAQLLDARQEVECVLVRHHHVGDDEIAVPLADPAPERRRIAGQAHLVAGTRQRLIEHGADRRVVVGNQNASRRHLHPSQVPPPGSASSPVNLGISTRKTVRRGWDSHSMIPP